MNLEDWLKILEYGHKYYIRIWCDSRVSEILNLSFAYSIHNNPFCSYMKSLNKGLERCIKCRKNAENVAVLQGAYTGHCINGIFEIVHPVFLNDTHVATVFIGNLISDRVKTEKLLKKSCERSSLSYNKARSYLSQAEDDFDTEILKNTAQAVSNLVIERLKSLPPEDSTENLTLINNLIGLARNYEITVSLNTLAAEFGYNRKYLGRLFKKHTGVSFCQYRNKIRLRDAADLLKNSNMKIIDAAIAVGYNNVAYFNKIFRAYYGMSPTEYREKN